MKAWAHFTPPRPKLAARMRTLALSTGSSSFPCSRSSAVGCGASAFCLRSRRLARARMASFSTSSAVRTRRRDRSTASNSPRSTLSWPLAEMLWISWLLSAKESDSPASAQTCWRPYASKTFSLEGLYLGSWMRSRARMCRFFSMVSTASTISSNDTAGPGLAGATRTPRRSISVCFQASNSWLASPTWNSTVRSETSKTSQPWRVSKCWISARATRVRGSSPEPAASAHKKNSIRSVLRTAWRDSRLPRRRMLTALSMIRRLRRGEAASAGGGAEFCLAAGSSATGAGVCASWSTAAPVPASA
mmetsp:Transcript_20764/g.65714  ORF Transcript_20764/g.65714 Transcript_20764/m.65714 type:complete len:304 (+) Transcript_20764:2672-3583(+)